jgi:hypothetical protein
MIESGAFFGAVAGSSAAIFGVGGAVMATRLVALAERAHTLKIEAGDFLNRSINRDEGLQAKWAEKLRIEALADLNVVARNTRRAVRWPLLSAVVLVWLALLPLIGWFPDARWYRVGLLGLMSIAALVWIWELDKLAEAIFEFTRNYALMRDKRRKELTDAGEPFIISGDPAALGRAADMLSGLLPEEVRKKPRVRRWVKRMRAFEEARQLPREVVALRKRKAA